MGDTPNTCWLWSSTEGCTREYFLLKSSGGLRSEWSFDLLPLNRLVIERVLWLWWRRKRRLLCWQVWPKTSVVTEHVVLYVLMCNCVHVAGLLASQPVRGSCLCMISTASWHRLWPLTGTVELLVIGSCCRLVPTSVLVSGQCCRVTCDVWPVWQSPYPLLPCRVSLYFEVLWSTFALVVQRFFYVQLYLVILVRSNVQKKRSKKWKKFCRDDFGCFCSKDTRGFFSLIVLLEVNHGSLRGWVTVIIPVLVLILFFIIFVLVDLQIHPPQTLLMAIATCYSTQSVWVLCHPWLPSCHCALWYAELSRRPVTKTGLRSTDWWVALFS